MEPSSSPPNNNSSIQRKLSFNMERNYRWDVQEQSGCISFSSFGVTLKKRPLDLLDESFDRSDEVSCPVSLVQLDKAPQHSPLVTPRSRQVLPVPAVVVTDRKKNSDDHHHQRGLFSLSDWFCTRFTGAEPSVSTGDQPSIGHGSSSMVEGSSVRIPDDIRRKLMMIGSDDDFDHDDSHHVKRVTRQRCPLPTFPSPPPPEEIEADYSTDGDEEASSFTPLFSLVA